MAVAAAVAAAAVVAAAVAAKHLRHQAKTRWKAQPPQRLALHRQPHRVVAVAVVVRLVAVVGLPVLAVVAVALLEVAPVAVVVAAAVLVVVVVVARLVGCWVRSRASTRTS